MPEITHTVDPETGEYCQIVSSKRLRAVLDADGDDCTRPSWLTDEDDWDVGEAEGA